MLKIVFMGTPDFAVSALCAAESFGCEFLGIVTQPDKPKGRGKHPASPPVKVWGEARGISVLQPDKVRRPEFMEVLREMAPDLIITAAFGQILPKELLLIPPLGCINVHASLLPRHRGASPIQQALIDGDSKTGITIMYMDVGMDTGDIILMRETPIDKVEDAGSLHDRLAALSKEALTDALALFAQGKPQGIPQDSDAATYCGKIDKAMGSIIWDQAPEVIINLVRGLTPWPGAYTSLSGERLKVWKVEHGEYLTLETYPPGTVLKADPVHGIIVACTGGTLRIATMQMPGGKPMDSREYVKGHPVVEGSVFI